MTSLQTENPKAWVQQCLGKRLLCTMKDGRQAYGILTCIDRLNNLILTDCIERRVITNTDYRTDILISEATTRVVVSRNLPQAMIPGHLLTCIQMRQEDYYKQTVECS